MVTKVILMLRWLRENQSLPLHLQKEQMTGLKEAGDTPELRS
jgi:hypothetical protein